MQSSEEIRTQDTVGLHRILPLLLTWLRQLGLSLAASYQVAHVKRVRRVVVNSADQYVDLGLVSLLRSQN